MKVYVLKILSGMMAGDYSIHWTMAQAAAAAPGAGVSYSILPYKLPPLIDVVASYLRFAGMTMPTDARDAFTFLVTEVGELGDALARSSESFAAYRRHNERSPSVAHEGGDVLKMLVVTLACLAAGDPVDGLLEKFFSKGWDGVYEVEE